MLALCAALLFGASTPLVQRFGLNVSTFWTAALLYAGAALIGALSLRPQSQEARLRPADLPRLAAMAACGAALGPVLLVWGLANTSGTSASLMLTLEAVFTAVLARWLYAEQMDHRVKAALGLLTAGGVLLVVDQAQAAGSTQWLGLLAVLGATAAWGLDNTLSRSLAERDPGQIVLGKSLLGALATVALALAFGAPVPALESTLWLLAVGATGYGLSLRLYLLAQREFGAARTGSVFAFAPFIGAVVAYALGERGASAWLMAGALLMLAGVVLHLMERHAHEHMHDALEHEHAHSHDDGHHLHLHAPMPAGAHSHLHRHEPLLHVHPHTPDAHHVHRH
jgi:drug/metabolite transporter (DMT)-like permease